MKKSQNDRILAYLKEGKSITPIEALELFGSLRLAARIADLKKKGHNITSQLVSYNFMNHGRYAEYKLV